MDLSLSIPSKSMGSIGLADCLKNFVASERMEKCGYKCSKCKAVDKMEKDITVYRFPKILVIHLKRFSRREKITTTVSLPKKLDLSVYGPYSSKLPIYICILFCCLFRALKQKAREKLPFVRDEQAFWQPEWRALRGRCPESRHINVVQRQRQLCAILLGHTKFVDEQCVRTVLHTIMIA